MTGQEKGKAANHGSTDEDSYALVGVLCAQAVKHGFPARPSEFNARLALQCTDQVHTRLIVQCFLRSLQQTSPLTDTIKPLFNAKYRVICIQINHALQASRRSDP